jgi:hypothetical protein
VTDSDSRTPAERVLDTDLITRALQGAHRHVLLEHKRDGDPIVVWQDGKVVWIPADEIVPRWTLQNRQFVDSQNRQFRAPAETGEFYFVLSSVCKSVWTFVRQLRGPHLSTWA